MGTRIKSTLLILATLVIGGIIGALIHAQVSEQRFERLESLRTNRGFARFIDRVIEFDTPEQREQVLDIVDAASVRLFENMQKTRRESRAILDSTRAKLAEVLSEEQLEQLDRHLTRRREGRRHRRGPMDDGPPPGPPPDM